MKIRKKKTKLTSQMFEEIDVALAVGAGYGIRESRVVKLKHKTRGGERVATFHVFPLDYNAAEIISSLGGDAHYHPRPGADGYDQQLKENRAFLAACLDFSKGAWSDFYRENNREITFPKDGTEEQRDEAINFLAGLFPFCNALRLACQTMSVAAEREIEDDEGNFETGSETEAEPGTKQKQKQSSKQAN